MKTETVKHKCDCFYTGAVQLCSLHASAPELLEALKSAQAHLEYCGYGDKWERECAREDKLSERISKAIAKAEGR